MKSLVLKDLVKDSSSNEQGQLLFTSLESALQKEEIVLLYVDSESTLSSSFLNSSIGLFLDKYGLDMFKKTVKFKGSKSQFLRLANYIKKYCSVYEVN